MSRQELERLQEKWGFLPMNEQHKPAEATPLQVWQNSVCAMLDDAQDALSADEWSVLRSILLKRLDTPQEEAA